MARIDAIDKVLGKKIYARDLRAKDIYGWGNLTHHALILRAIFIDRIYLGLDTGYIQTKFNPYKILTSQELENDGFDLTVRYISDPDRDPLHKDLFAKVGTNPEYVGQPTALLLFERYADFFDASRELKGLYRAQIYGEQNIENIETINLDRELKQWLKTERIPEPNYSSRQYFGAIDNDLEAVEEEKRQQYSKEIIKKHHAITFKTSTPSIDPMFLEPESTLTRIYENDNQNRILEIYVGTQAPDKDKSTILALLRGVPEAKKINKVEVLACHLGGGFGGRDLSTIPLYSAIAAFYSHPIPVRLAYDRFEQFQCGTKRHASIVENTVAIDKAGNLKAILSHFIFDGGSVKDLTSSVAGLATLHVAGPYQFEHWNLNSVSLPSKGPLSGSMRGFGIPQVCFNIEQIIDSIASKLKQDPIDFRLKHLLKEGDKDVSNQILHNNLNNDQICHIAKSTPIWQNREQIRKTNSDEEVLHGVGFAMTMEAFGTTNDGCYVVVSITEKNEFVIETEVVEMGQGALTSLASVPKKFFDFDAAQIYQGRTDNFTDQFQLESRDRDHPRYVYAGGSSTSASKTAFFHVHILEEACQLYLASARESYF